jgi:hypothetical protein
LREREREVEGERERFHAIFVIGAVDVAFYYFIIFYFCETRLLSVRCLMSRF